MNKRIIDGLVAIFKLLKEAVELLRELLTVSKRIMNVMGHMDSLTIEIRNHENASQQMLQNVAEFAEKTYHCADYLADNEMLRKGTNDD